MVRTLILLMMVGFWTSVAQAVELNPPRLDDRWFYASFGVENDAKMEELSELIQRASDSGLNGMLWACGVENYAQWDDARKTRLAKIRKTAEEKGIEIIPILWSIGYGTMINENPNLAEGLPIRDLSMMVSDGRADSVSDACELPNGSMEQWKENRLTEYAFHDQPAEISFCDTQIAHSGETSIRFENFTANPHGHGRLMKEMALTPERLYRASIWFKTENIRGNLQLQIYDQDGGSLASARPAYKPGETTDWTKVSVTFKVPKDGKIRIYAGIWGGEAGRFWLDDLSIESIGLVNPLRRDGTPMVVTDATGKALYEEGKDWVLPKFRLQPWNVNAEGLKLIIPEGSRIRDGETLLVDYYYPPLVGAPQIGTCMSEPELYERFEASARVVMEALAPKKWFLSMDEIRCAGTCQACHDRNISLAAILGDCITKQYEIIRKTDPGAEVYIWSDMLDPNHNAHGNYYVCDGDYTGVWELVPKELIISCWYHDIREKSMKFFSERGFRTQAAAYYDADTLEGCTDWLETCRKTPGCIGIMYTTWEHKYTLLEGFGKMLRE
ncbi:MAG: hypothetical protein PHE53_01650 [Thermoguttaceae bacterium]|nr:hypothetical protein [Thermoguttaceae bacterium]